MSVWSREEDTSWVPLGWKCSAVTKSRWPLKWHWRVGSSLHSVAITERGIEIDLLSDTQFTMVVLATRTLSLHVLWVTVTYCCISVPYYCLTVLQILKKRLKKRTFTSNDGHMKIHTLKTVSIQVQWCPFYTKFFLMNSNKLRDHSLKLDKPDHWRTNAGPVGCVGIWLVWNCILFPEKA